MGFTKKGKNVFGCSLIILAVAQFFIGAMNLIEIQRTALLSPIDIFPLALCVTAPAIVFLMGGILAFNGLLTLPSRNRH